MNLFNFSLVISYYPPRYIKKMNISNHGFTLIKKFLC